MRTIRVLSVLAPLSRVGCSPVEEGEYVITPAGGSSGTCGAAYAELYFPVEEPIDVTLDVDEPGSFELENERRDIVGLGDIVCEDQGATFTCTIYAGTIPAADIDAVVTAFADASGTWAEGGSATGDWTLDSACEGADCGAITGAYGTDLPCSYAGSYTMERQARTGG